MIADVWMLHSIISYCILNTELDVIGTYLDYVLSDACLNINPS
jgi:hypothetical protein